MQKRREPKASQLSARKPLVCRRDGPHTTVAVMFRTTAWAFSGGGTFTDQQVPIILS
jgi:hypothetical protein